MKRQPSYRRQKEMRRPDRAFVDIDGRRIHLGEYGTAESWKEYHRVIAEWAANGRQLPVDPEELTVMELAARFMRHAREYYRKPDGSPSSTLEHFKQALRPLKNLYEETAVSEFGPRALKAVRVAMLDLGQARTTINKRVMALKQIFRWGVAEELVRPAVYQALQAVSGLKRGRSEAHETDRVRPVAETHVEAIKPHVSRQVWALVELQLLTAARPGELILMRPCDLDSSGEIWTYTLPNHKTSYHGHTRTVYLGPKSQRILRPFLKGCSPSSCVFSPREAEEERRRKLHEGRKTPLSCGNRPGSNRKKSPTRLPKERYTVTSYGRAITRACDRAGIPRWHSHQLRHNAASYLRKEFGLDAARVILGHRSPAITDVYAELDREKAVEIMIKIG